MRYITAGESHGPSLTAIIDHVPAGLMISEEKINTDLARRQGGYGRGGRMKIERDQVKVLSGIRFGKTLGSPITLQVENKDWENWVDRMAPFGEKPVGLEETHPRPGHADLIGALKTATDDCRDILERSSARETAARVAAGGVAKALLVEFGVTINSYVRRIGDVSWFSEAQVDSSALQQAAGSPVSCPDESTSDAMCAAIDAARAAGESLGGEFVVLAHGLIPGLGDYAVPQDRLTARIGGALFSIPAIKGIEFGGGFGLASMPGSKVHDEIDYDDEKGYTRLSNNAGGLEGGMTNGESLVVSGAMKPIPTLMKPLQSVDMKNHETHSASTERSDVCAVPAAAVVAEAELAFVLANAYCEKFGSDSLCDMKSSFNLYSKRIRS